MGFHILSFFKGYGKLNPMENYADPKPERHPRWWLIIAFAVSVLILLSLIAALAYESATETEESEPLKTVCAVTRFPKTCFSSIAPLNNPPVKTPISFFNLSLHASIQQVFDLKNLSHTAVSEMAIQDCAEMLDDAASQLARSAGLVRGCKMLTDVEISNLQTWISAAMTGEETCVDGLAEMKSTALDEFHTGVQKSQEYLSNTLAILANIQFLSNKLMNH